VAVTWLLAGTITGAPVRVDATAVPPLRMLHAVACTFDVPVLVKTTTQTSVAEVQDVTCADTWAELVKDPKSPNTKPAIAMAAMSVIAIRITVARTGEIAFLRLGLLMFMMDYLSRTRRLRMALKRRC